MQLKERQREKEEKCNKILVQRVCCKREKGDSDADRPPIAISPHVCPPEGLTRESEHRPVAGEERGSEAGAKAGRREERATLD